jgi:hypothetical protein
MSTTPHGDDKAAALRPLPTILFFPTPDGTSVWLSRSSRSTEIVNALEENG